MNTRNEQGLRMEPLCLISRLIGLFRCYIHSRLRNYPIAFTVALALGAAAASVRDQSN